MHGMSGDRLVGAPLVTREVHRLSLALVALQALVKQLRIDVVGGGVEVVGRQEGVVGMLHVLTSAYDCGFFGGGQVRVQGAGQAEQYIASWVFSKADAECDRERERER